MIDVDAKKWKAFRLWCANQGTTMKAEIDQFLEKFVKEVNH